MTAKQAHYDCDIDHIVENLRFAKEHGQKTCLLLGAGCSVSAGIPASNGIITIIMKKFPAIFRNNPPNSYPECLSRLTGAQQRTIIADCISNAKVNWAHIGIALLIKHGFVDRILTTNFDPLISRACYLLAEYPAVYDLAVSDRFNPHYISDKAIFHLHGQHTGFVLINTEQQSQDQLQRITPVMENTGTARVWIVAGYSGNNDPVFDQLTKFEKFENRLYWVGYKDEQPSTHVREKLLSCNKEACYVSGYDADDFFVTLTQKLNIFPPGSD